MQKVLGHKGRIITTQFASNIHRLYGVKAAADASGRKIAFVGMSLNTYLEAAKKSGIAPIDPETLVPAEEINQVNPDELIIVTTGSQAEPRAQLAQAAFGSSRLITLRPDDLLLYSAKMIPGNEKRVMRMMNAIATRGPEIAMKREDGLHSSGHAYRDELEEVLKMLHPEHFLPVHGEYAFLKEHEALARRCGVRHSTVIGNGQMLGVTPLRNSQTHGLWATCTSWGEARLQTMFNDGGKGSGTSEDLAVEERMRIATEGIVVVDLEVFDGALRRAEDAVDAPEDERRRAASGTIRRVARRSCRSRARASPLDPCGRTRGDSSRISARLRRNPSRDSRTARGSARWSERRRLPFGSPVATTATSDRTSSSSRIAELSIPKVSGACSARRRKRRRRVGRSARPGRSIDLAREPARRRRRGFVRCAEATDPRATGAETDTFGRTRRISESKARGREG